MFKRGLRNLLNRLSRDMEAKAQASYGGLTHVCREDEAARDEFITAYVVAREPVTAAHAARLSRHLAAGTGSRN